MEGHFHAAHKKRKMKKDLFYERKSKQQKPEQPPSSDPSPEPVLIPESFPSTSSASEPETKLDPKHGHTDLLPQTITSTTPHSSTQISAVSNTDQWAMTVRNIERFDPTTIVVQRNEDADDEDAESLDGEEDEQDRMDRWLLYKHNLLDFLSRIIASIESIITWR